VKQAPSRSGNRQPTGLPLVLSHCLPRAVLTFLILALLCAPAAAAKDRSLARTPPMGWNSWYAYRCDVDEDEILANARAMVDSGMKAAGYEYVNVDGCWNAPARDAKGRLQADPATFPSGMRALGERIHALGLKFGIYTSAGRTICLHDQPGSYNHYRRDFRTFARWGIDYVKVDWCDPDPSQHLRSAYGRVARAARHAGRKMIVTVSTPGISEPWTWGRPYGQSWRIAPDLDGSWPSLMSVLDVAAKAWRYGGPAGWNDADMLQVGNGVLTPDEERAHFSLWSIIASPLLASVPLPAMSEQTRAILTNRAVIAVNQDPLGRPGRRVRSVRRHELWVKPLKARHCRAVALLNRGERAHTFKVDLRRLRGVPRARSYSVRDLWAHSRTREAKLAVEVPAHGAGMFKVCPR
jgi:alpha-galactosidase